MLARNLFATTAVFAAYAAAAAAVTLQPTVMAIAAIVASVAAIGWGLMSWQSANFALDSQIADALHTDCTCSDHGIDSCTVHQFDELLYVPIDRGRAPVWDTDIAGAPE